MYQSYNILCAIVKHEKITVLVLRIQRFVACSRHGRNSKVGKLSAISMPVVLLTQPRLAIRRPLNMTSRARGAMPPLADSLAVTHAEHT